MQMTRIHVQLTTDLLAEIDAAILASPTHASRADFVRAALRAKLSPDLDIPADLRAAFTQIAERDGVPLGAYLVDAIRSFIVNDRRKRHN